MSKEISMANSDLKKFNSTKNKSMRKSKLLGGYLLTVILVLGSLVMIIPFLWMVLTSFDWAARLNIPFPPRFWPKEITTKTYEAAFTNIPMLKYMFNSLIISAGVIFVSLMSALLIGICNIEVKV